MSNITGNYTNKKALIQTRAFTLLRGWESRPACEIMHLLTLL